VIQDLLLHECDVLLHECTLFNEDERRALVTGHSNISMVGNFTRRIHAKNLILTHIGASATLNDHEDILSKISLYTNPTTSLFLANDLDVFVIGEILKKQGHISSLFN